MQLVRTNSQPLHGSLGSKVNPNWLGAWESIERVDLSGPMMKLGLLPPEGEGWTSEQVMSATLWYRRFLMICAKYPDHPAVPNGPIDEVWHAHILDTSAYAKDCHAVFGGMLHHYPYFGLRGDSAERDLAFDQTNRLYMLEFGEDCLSMVTLFSDEATRRGFNCNHSGGGTGCGQGCNRGVVKN